MTSLSFKNSCHTAKIKTLADAAFLCVFGKTGHFVKYCGAGVTLLARLAGVLAPEPSGLWIAPAAIRDGKLANAPGGNPPCLFSSVTSI
jgi:hypothetical protein